MDNQGKILSKVTLVYLRNGTIIRQKQILRWVSFDESHDAQDLGDSEGEDEVQIWATIQWASRDMAETLNVKNCSIMIWKTYSDKQMLFYTSYY